MVLVNFLKSTILSKIVMATTGIILVLFLIGHAIGNLQVFLGREVYNNYAHFLQSLGELLWVIRGVLFVCLVLHIITSVKLKIQNLVAKPTKYHVKNYLKAKLTSRTMIWTGTMLFCFLVYHLLHFTAGVTNPDQFKYNEYYSKDAKYLVEMPRGEVTFENKNYVPIDQAKILFERHDVYKMVVLGFRNPLITLFYILFVVLVGFHLNHAIQSALQTLGFNHPKYFDKMIICSRVLTVLIVIAFIIVPLSIITNIAGAVI